MWFILSEKFRRMPLWFIALDAALIVGAISRLVLESGEKTPSTLCSIFVYAAFWPAMATAPFIHQPLQAASVLNLCLSLAGWALLGVLVAEARARLELRTKTKSI
jgi:hypothetical protein